MVRLLFTYILLLVVILGSFATLPFFSITDGSSIEALTFATPRVYAAEIVLPYAPNVSFIDKIFNQIQGVFGFTAQAIGAVLDINSKTFSRSTTTLPDAFTTTGIGDSAHAITNNLIPNLPDRDGGSLVINVPLVVTSNLSIKGQSDFAGATVHGVFVAVGKTELQSLLVKANTQLQTLAVSGSATFVSLQVAGSAVFNTLQTNGRLSALGGIQTNGADVDLGSGNVYAANIINSITAGSNITISGTPNAPIITARVPGHSTPNLADVRAVGGCPECITDSDVVPGLSIAGGSINNTPIGLTTASNASFTDVRVGTTSATSSLEVNGALALNGSLAVQGNATSTFNASINVTSGCVAVNNVCLGGGVAKLNDLTDVTLATTSQGDVLVFDGAQWKNVSTSSLGFGDNTFLGLKDTPSSFTANALSFVNSSGTALIQSPSLVFTGTRLGIGTSTPLDTLSVAGTVGVLGQQALRFYDSTNTHYVGLKASTTISTSTIWSLPSGDGLHNELLVTDGAGNLHFASVGSIGGGSATYVGLADTPSSLLYKAIPYVASTTNTLTQSTGFVYDGSHLGIGNYSPTANLTVQGDVSFQPSTSTVGFFYNNVSNKVGIGTVSPSDSLTIQNGSFVQRGAASGGTYIPTQIGTLGLTDNIMDIATVGNYAYVVTAGTGNDFHVLDTSNSASPVEIASLALPDGANGVYVSGNYAYIVTNVAGDDFNIIDISNPKAPVALGSVDLSTSASDVVVRGHFAYVTTLGAGNDFHVIDVGNPLTPREVASLALPDGANGLDVNGNYAYVATNVGAGSGLYEIDISTSTLPTITTSISLPAVANHVSIQGQYAYVVTSGTGNDFHIIDISNPASLSEAGSLNLSTGGTSVAVSGVYAYVSTSGTGDDFHVINIVSPSTPVEVGSLELAAGAGLSVAVVGKKAYEGSSFSGQQFHIIDVTGIDVQSAHIDSLETGSLSALGDFTVAGSITLGKGLRSGIAGLQTDGSLFVQGSQTSFIANKLGIGTSTPSTKLDVWGNLRIGTSSIATLYVNTANGKVGIGTSTPSAKLDVWGNLRVGTSSIAALFVNTANGRVGIGTVSPTDILQIGSVTGQNAYFDSFHSGLHIRYQTEDRAFLTSNTAAEFGAGYAGLGGLRLMGQDSSSYGYITSGATNQILINSNGGNVGIGTTTPNSFKLQVSGDIGPDASNAFNLGAAGKNWGCLYYDNSTVGTCASDARLKTNITDLLFDTPTANALDQIMGLRLRSFAYKTAPSSRYDGLIAQEVQAIAPELVVQDPSTSLLSVKYGDVQWLTIAALQQLNGNISQLLITGSTSATSSLASLLAANPDSVWSRLTNLAHGFVGGILTIVGIHTQEVTTDKLCLGATCVDETQLKSLLHDAGQSGGTSQDHHNSDTNSDTPEATSTAQTDDQGSGQTASSSQSNSDQNGDAATSTVDLPSTSTSTSTNSDESTTTEVTSPSEVI